MYLLGVDLGSSSIKVALINAATQTSIAVAQHPKSEMKIDAPSTGWAEQNPADWWYHFKEALKEVLEISKIDTNKILGIGIAYQMHGLVVVDKEQEVLRPSIIWCDSRAVKIGQRAFDSIGHEYCIQHYLNSPGNFTASKLKWVKDHEPELYSRIDKMMLPGDYLAMKMTAKIRTTISGLSEAVLWDFKHGKIASDILTSYGISEQLIPSIVDTFSEQGKLTNKAATELGLTAGTPVSYRAGDQANNALSLGVIHPNTVAATGGTSGVVYGIVDQAKADAQSRVNGFAHVNHTHDDPRIGILLCINGAGSQYAWIKNQIASQKITYLEMEEKASAIPIGSEGLCILPFGNGSERMLENQYHGASIYHLEFSRHGKAHFYRAALEGIAFSFVYGLELMRDIGIDAKNMFVGNDNLFQSAIFANTIATLAHVNIEMIETTGAIGAAKGAGFGMGYYASLEEAVGQTTSSRSYQPATNNKAYLEAYKNWKAQLEKQYKN